MSEFWKMMDDQRSHLHEMIDNQIEDLKTHEEQLRELIQKWRDEAQELRNKNTTSTIKFFKETEKLLTLENCANELEAIL